MKKSKISLNDRQLACAKISSPVGQNYLAAMASAANFAFCNRSMMAAAARKAFTAVFSRSPKDMEMHQVLSTPGPTVPSSVMAAGCPWSLNPGMHWKGGGRSPPGRPACAQPLPP